LKNSQQAQQLLMGLGTLPQVVKAQITLADGTPLANFNSQNESALEPQKSLLNRKITSFTEKIVLDDEPIGWVRLWIEEGQTLQNVDTISVSSALILLGCFIGALILALLSHRFISFPILKLAIGLKVVSGQRDFSVRLEKQSNDEIGAGRWL
jgi:methyl-accepting chemotaxis protein